MKPPESKRIFISYAKADRVAAKSVYAHLRQCGYLLWIDYNDIRFPGSLFYQITNGIYECDIFLLLRSSASALSSWVRFEVAQAKAFKKPKLVIEISPVSTGNVTYRTQHGGGNFVDLP